MLNLNKTDLIQFTSKNIETTQAYIKYRGNYKQNTNKTTFLGLIVDKTLSWQSHLDKLSSKLSSASYIITLKPILTIKNLKVIYYSYAHSIISYGLIFWGNSSHNNMNFKIQKQIIRIIANSNHRTSCRDIFKKLNILPLQTQYILPLAMFVVGNFEEFSTNTDTHSFNTRQNPTCTLHQHGWPNFKRASIIWVLRSLINYRTKFSTYLTTKNNSLSH
jgi:hypothetical protein